MTISEPSIPSMKIETVTCKCLKNKANYHLTISTICFIDIRYICIRRCNNGVF